MNQFSCLKNNNAFDDYPLLKASFSVKNEDISFISHGCNKKYLFICSLCNKEYLSSVKDWIRAHKRNKIRNICKHAILAIPCSKRKFNIKESALDHNSEAMKEWDYENNTLLPNELSFGSEKVVYWKCNKCNSKYKTKLYKRTVDKSNCPYCNGKKVNETNCLASIFPELVLRLKNKDLGNKLAIYSSKKVDWQCHKCLQYFNNTVYSVVNSYKNKNNSRCPYCAGRKTNEFNSLEYRYPTIAKEWNNKNLQSANEYTPGSRKKVWWKCSLNHEWQATINSRSKGSGCPFCCHKISKPEIAWLDSLNLNLERQKRIIIEGKVFKFDGFDPVTKTVYEFYGDYYHGNPKVFPSEKYNQTCKRTFGELHQRTLEKEAVIKKYYKLITKWET